ncbi:MAG: 5-oxoprolinase subunit PxpB [Hyphomicrobiaceae bacterium]
MPRLLASGDTALVVEFGDTVDRAINAQVMGLADRIEAETIPGIVELVPTFRSLMIHYDPLTTSHAKLAGEMQRLLQGLDATERSGRLWRIPVCYEGEMAPDLEDVARATKLTTAEVVTTHAGEIYQVYCVGFLPGFPYMGDLPAALELPRRTSPRIRLPQGSVCMAMRMTGVYPIESPGGWHLLGRTPVRLFDRRRRDAVLMAPGDQVKFEPIKRAEFDQLDAAATAGTLDLEPARAA